MKISIVLVSTTIILILSLLSGCTKQEVIVNVKPPPQIDLSKFQRIAIGDFQGRGGVDIAAVSYTHLKDLVLLLQMEVEMMYFYISLTLVEQIRNLW